MTQGERVRAIRKDLGLTMDKFGARLGVSKMAISNIESGNRNLTDQMAKAICREFNISEEWLRYETGDPHIPLPDEFAAYVKDLLSDNDNQLYDIIRGIMKTYHGLDEKSKEVFKMIGKELLENLKKD